MRSPRRTLNCRESKMAEASIRKRGPRLSEEEALAVGEYLATLYGQPTTEDLAEAHGVSAEEVQKALDAYRSGQFEAKRREPLNPKSIAKTVAVVALLLVVAAGG